MGGGRAGFIPNDQEDPEEGYGNRKDGQNLIDAWVADKEQRKQPYAFVWNKDQLSALNDSNAYVLGKLLF